MFAGSAALATRRQGALDRTRFLFDEWRFISKSVGFPVHGERERGANPRLRPQL
jgi:hypothetical protein